MNLTRRSLMAGASALTLMPKFGFASGNVEVLEARSGKAQLVSAEYPDTEIWGYDGKAPGPEIRVPQAARIQRKLLNSLNEPTTIHWHGIRIDNAMDGVPGVTQEAVQPNGEFSYDFTVPDAGTYWYHSHFNTTEQISRGLYGALIVEEPNAPEVDHDITVIVDDWRLDQNAQIDPDFKQVRDWTHGGRLGNFLKATLTPALNEVKQNQRLRLRFICVATDRVMRLALVGMAGKIVALDGMPVDTPTPVEMLTLGPAQRADVIVDITGATGEKAMIGFVGREQTIVLASLDITGQASLAPRPEIMPLPANPIQQLGTIEGAQITALNMEGGAMGGLQSGIYKGKRMTTEELVQNGQIWTFNGVAGMPESPLAEISLGETLRIPIINDTSFAHAMHLHGMHFQEIFADGSFGPLRDTILIERQETREIAFTASNPGDWVFHCHMISHQAAGMMTWVRVTA
ncbi:MAG: multicopper oxidase family protein [Rhodobacteraceae bacterium]|nr:multicopper oxidase family protein [Paracoccaceae bacterium]